MELNASLIFWILIGAAGILFAVGIRNKSWKAFMWSGITIFLPSTYFFGAENWIRILGLVPLIPFCIAYFIAKNRAAE